MRPIGTDGKPWPAEWARLAGEEIRQQCIADLTKRDESKGIVGGVVTRAVIDETALPDENGQKPTRNVVDPAKAQDKHKGDETIALFLGRWATFCEQKQDLVAFQQRVQTTDQKALAAAKAASAEIEATLPADESAKVPDIAPPRRGRPPKSTEPEAVTAEE